MDAGLRRSAARPGSRTRTMLLLGSLLLLGLAGVGHSPLAPDPAEAQILPPIYKPLPLEETERHRLANDSLRTAASAAITQAEALENGARSLRTNGSRAIDRLLEEAQRLTEQSNRLEVQLRVDALALPALNEQRSEFLQRALEREEVLHRQQLRLDLSEWEGAPEERADPATLRAQLRADSILIETFRQEAELLARRSQLLEMSIVSARQRIAALQEQEKQLRDFAREISSGHSEHEPTARRLEAEAHALRRTAERLSLEARVEGERAEALRVQADRAVLPVRSRLDAMRFYGEDGRAVLKTLVFSLSDPGKAGSINSELVSDYAGPLRLGVGFVVAEGRASESADSTRVSASRAAAIERFYAGGGNFVVYSSLPLAFHRSPYHSLTVQTLNKVALDVPGTRHQAGPDQVPTNLDLGIEAYATLNSYGSRIKAFGLLRSALSIGNDAFYTALDRQGGAFPYAQLTLGTEIATVAKILLSGAHAPEGVGRALTLTFQVAR